MKADGRSSADAGTVQPASPAFQIIILGAGGGPNEDNVTGLLVRSTARQWTRDSVLAVDAGVHLAAIIKIFEEHLPQASLRKPTVTSAAATPVNGDNLSTPTESSRPKLCMATGPFANLELPHETAKANATYVFRSLISTYLITHPHLDHVAGFAINTAALQQTLRRKRVAALPSTIEAIKEHIFNGVIWPNLSDEGDGAVGFVSYDRLVDGGNVALGDGEGRGYIEVCDGLAVKGWSVSHGECMRHSHHQGSYSSESTEAGYTPYYSRRSSSRKDLSSGSMDSARSQSFSQVSSEKKAYDSAAYFLRDEHTGKEVLIFGDVEPDSVSLNPRTARVWQDAAAKLSAGLLTGVLIECSYDDSQPDSMLFGHLTPRHLVIELGVLAGKVKALAVLDGKPGSPRKRKRPSNGHKIPSDELQSRRPPSRHHVRRRTRSSVSPSTALRPESPRQSSSEMVLTNEDAELGPIVEEHGSSHQTTNSRHEGGASKQSASTKPLEGLKVIIIHIKDPLRDGSSLEEMILAQLQEHERESQLGCTFIVSQSGTSIWL
ncbi:3',5'-cyclic-nucleotide phosphodiesterase pde1 [Xanthoria parietina]